MAALFNWLSNDEVEVEQTDEKAYKPAEKPTRSSSRTPAPNGNQYVTRQDMMDALDKMQKRIEDRLHAERNKRVQSVRKLADDVVKQIAEVDANTERALQEQQQHLAKLPKSSVGAMAPEDVDRLAQILAQREPRLAALVDKSSVGPSGYDDGRSYMSGVSDPGSKTALLEELKAKVERLEEGSKKLVAAAAEALVSRGSEEFLEDGALPTTRSLDDMSDTDPPGFDDKVLAWTTKLDTFESDNLLFSRRIADVEIKIRSLEQELDRRVQASVKKEIKSFALDRGR